jgi:hypothetical protein
MTTFVVNDISDKDFYPCFALFIQSVGAVWFVTSPIAGETVGMAALLLNHSSGM